MDATRLFRRHLAALAVALSLILPVSRAAAADTASPVLAADQFHLADHAGEVVLVDFWASWCKPCAMSMPWLSKLAAAHADRGLVVIAVNLDKDLARADEMIAELDPHIVVVHDPEGTLASEHDLAGMPSSFLYDRHGELSACHVGFLPAEADAREQEIIALLNRKDAADAR